MTRRPVRRLALMRSPREWALRGGLAAIALALGYVSTTQTLAFAIRKSKPERAHALAPGDGRVAAELAEQMVAGDVLTAQHARGDQIAHRALADEPLAAPALTALAIITQLRGDTAQARRLFVHSDALSRRELGTRLWLIEDAVARGDVRRALRHYDIALRTARGASDVLFPVMAAASTEPSIAAALIDSMAARPPWTAGFLSYLANSGAAPRPIAVLFRRLALRGVAVPVAVQKVIVDALIDSGNFNDAWDYYRSLHPDADRLRSRDAGFTAQGAVSSKLDWTLVPTDSGLTASIQATPKGGLLDFAAPPMVGGAVAQQVQLLPPGRYRISGTSTGVEQKTEDRPYWQLACNDGRELARIALAAATENAGRFSGEFVVDGDCPAQTLRLVLRPSTQGGGVSGQVARVAIAPVGGAR